MIGLHCLSWCRRTFRMGCFPENSRFRVIYLMICLDFSVFGSWGRLGGRCLHFRRWRWRLDCCGRFRSLSRRGLHQWQHWRRQLHMSCSGWWYQMTSCRPGPHLPSPSGAMCTRRALRAPLIEFSYLHQLFRDDLLPIWGPLHRLA